MITDEELEARRKAVNAILAGERKQIEVAADFGVSRQAVSLWVRTLRETGDVTDRRSRVKKARFAIKQEADLRSAVENQRPSDFDIQTDDDKWGVFELQDLVFVKYRRRAERKQCIDWLSGWGVLDEESAKAQRRRRRAPMPMRPVNLSESEELIALLEAAKTRATEDEDEDARETTADDGPSPKQRRLREERQRKKKQVARKKNKQARKARSKKKR